MKKITLLIIVVFLSFVVDCEAAQLMGLDEATSQKTMATTSQKTMATTSQKTSNKNRYKDSEYIKVGNATLISKSSPLAQYGSDWDQSAVGSWRIEGADVLFLDPFEGIITQWGGQSDADYFYIGCRCTPKHEVAYVVVDNITAYAGMRAFEKAIYNDWLQRGMDDCIIHLRALDGPTILALMPMEAQKAILGFVKAESFICWEISMEFCLHPRVSNDGQTQQQPQIIKIDNRKHGLSGFMEDFNEAKIAVQNFRSLLKGEWWK